MPDAVIPADIDEAPRKDELPRPYVARMAREKALAIASDDNDHVLAADTVVACGRRILPKAMSENVARSCLKLLSGRRHRVYTAVSLKSGDNLRERLVMTMVKFRRLTDADLDWYLASGDWHGKAGGYAIQGKAEIMIPEISGSYSGVVGLPVVETSGLLEAIGYHPARP